MDEEQQQQIVDTITAALAAIGRTPIFSLIDPSAVTDIQGEEVYPPRPACVFSLQVY
jgi:hypothetical protein